MANEDKRIIELPASTSILNDDWIAKDSASQDTTRLQLSFLKQLCGGNNFAGEWHSGTTYPKESYVTHEGKLYHNIKGTSVVADSWTSSQWTQVSIGNELRKIVESLAPTFDTSTNYKVDDLVIYNNTLYRCIVAHTAGTWISSHFATVKVSSLLLSSIMDNFTDLYWENYSGSPVNYTKGTVIHKGLKLYRCKADTTNQSWVSSKWEQVDVTDLIATEHGYIQSLFSIIAPTFSTSTSYNVDDFVVYNNQLYMCIYPHNGAWNSGHFLLCTVSNTLQALYRNLADTYSFSGAYVKGDVVNYAGVLWRCIVDTATSPIVFSEWEQVTVAQLIDEKKVNDVQIAGQTTTDENHISDLTSLAIEGTASGEIASFSDGSNLPMRSFICNIDAVQDLHGYDVPWVGGAGKNKLPLTVDGIKAVNTDGTWTGNAYVINGITYTILTDSNNNVIGIKANGTASANAMLDLNPTGSLTIPANTTFSLSGCPEGGGGSTYRLYPKGGTSATYDNGSGKLITLDSAITNPFRINVYSGAQVDNIIFYPMIVFANAIDMDFAPYSNICPISGHTGVDAVISPTTEASAGTTYSISWQTEAGEVFGGYVDLVSGVLTVTHRIENCKNLYFVSGVSSGGLNYADISISIGNTPISNKLKYVEKNIGWASTAFCISVDNYNRVRVYGRLSDFEDGGSYENTMVCYELKTPITYQLTPQQIKSLLGNNNAWCSTGDVNTKYNKDATIVINSLIARIEALENA